MDEKWARGEGEMLMITINYVYGFPLLAHHLRLPRPLKCANVDRWVIKTFTSRPDEVKSLARVTIIDVDPLGRVFLGKRATRKWILHEGIIIYVTFASLAHLSLPFHVYHMQHSARLNILVSGIYERSSWSRSRSFVLESDQSSGGSRKSFKRD